MTQTFQQYPTPEYAWNTADEILLGNIELDMNNDNVKAKRLRFAILPDYTDENTLKYIDAKSKPNIKVIIKPIEQFYNYKYKQHWIENHKKNESDRNSNL